MCEASIIQVGRTLVRTHKRISKGIDARLLPWYWQPLPNAYNTRPRINVRSSRHLFSNDTFRVRNSDARSLTIFDLVHKAGHAPVAAYF
jgi:hypothetical protein